MHRRKKTSLITIFLIMLFIFADTDLFSTLLAYFLVAAVIYFVFKKLFGNSDQEKEITPVYRPEKEKPVKPAEPVKPVEKTREEEIIEQGNHYLTSICNNHNNIQDEEVTDVIKSIVKTSRLILDDIKTHPDDVGKVNKFIDYYLPTVDKLIASYREYQEGETEQFIEAKNKIINTLKSTDDAFKKIYESLFENDVIDTLSETKVMEDMLKQEGYLSELGGKKDE